MKSTAAVILSAALAAASAYHLGSAHQRAADRAYIASLRSTVERYTDPEVLAGVRKVSRLTGRPFFQVLTGYSEPKKGA